jgi:hypothetical protein
MRHLLACTALFLMAGSANAAQMVRFVFTGDANVSFELPKSPTPDIVTNFIFRIDNITVDFNGTQTNLTFFAQPDPNPGFPFVGGFRLFDAPNQSNVFFGSGPQIYTGSLSAPTFVTGTYDLTAFAFNRTVPGAGQLVISDVGGAVPEPSSWALLLAGFGLTGMAMRRRAALRA